MFENTYGALTINFMSVDSKEKYTDWYFYAFLNFISHLQWAKGEKKNLFCTQEVWEGPLYNESSQGLVSSHYILLFTLVKPLLYIYKTTEYGELAKHLLYAGHHGKALKTSQWAADEPSSPEAVESALKSYCTTSNQQRAQINCFDVHLPLPLI